jgi:hypothetical protein
LREIAAPVIQPRRFRRPPPPAPPWVRRSTIITSQSDHLRRVDRGDRRAQLAKLDGDSAREIRDIVNEIIAIKTS